MAVIAPIISTFDSKGVKEAEKQFKGLEKKLKTALGVAAFVQFGKAAITAAEEGQKSAARIEQIAKQMNLFGGETAKVTKRLLDYSDTLARSTGIDDDVIKSTQAKLLTFENLARSADKVNGSFDRATRAALDLAAAGFGEAESNAVQLGKALQDPIKGIAALAKAGVTFTAEQKKLIQTLVDSGDLLGAQDVILGAIEQQVGGTADATATASGKMSVAFDQLTESVGLAVLPAFEALVNAIIPLVDLFTSLPGNMQTAIIVALGLGAAYLKLRAIVTALKLSVSTLNVAFAAVAIATEAYFLLAGNGADDAASAVADFTAEIDRLNDAQALRNFEETWNSVRDNLDLGITDLASWDITGDRQDEVAREKLRQFVADFARGNLEAAKRVRDLLAAQGQHESMTRYLTSAIYDEEVARGNLTENQKRSLEQYGETENALQDVAQAHKDVADAAREQLDAQLALISEELALRSAQRGVQTGLEDYNELIKSITDGTYEGENAWADAAEAQDEFLSAAIRTAAAADAQAKAVAEATDQQYDAADSALVQKRSLEEIIKTLAPDSPLRKALLEYIGILENKIPERITTQFAANISFTYDQATLARFPGLVQYRAAGGPVSASTPYLVGENGPEMFTPSVGGYVSPTSRIGAGGGTAAGGAVYHITVNGAVDPVGTARTVKQLLQDDGKRRNQIPVPA